jgi:polysaccharide biosynthesis transport protein
MANLDSDYAASEVYPAMTAGPERSQAMVAAGPYAAPMAIHQGGYLPRGPEILHGGFDQSWLFHCLRRRWLLSLLMGLLVGGATAFLLLLLFPQSSSIVSYLQVKSKPPKAVFADDDLRLTPKDYEVFQQTQVALLKSTFVLNAALTSPGISQLDAVQKELPEPVLWLQDELRVSFPGEGEILEVRYDGEEDPEDMKRVVNAVIKAYQDDILYKERTRASATRLQLSKLYMEVKKELREKFDEYEKLATQLGGANSASAEADINMLLSELRLNQQQIADAKKSMIDLDVFKAVALQDARSVSTLEMAVQAELALDPMLQRYMEQQYMIDMQIADVDSTSKRSNSPQLKRLRHMRFAAEQDLQKYRVTKEREIRDRLKGAPNDVLAKTMTEYAMRKKAGEEMLAELEATQKEKLDQLRQRGARSPLLQMMEQELDQQREIEGSIAIRLRSWTIEADTAQDRIQVISPASASENINQVQRFSIAGVGGLAAFCLTCYGIAMMEFGRRRLNGAQQVDEGLGIRVLGALPSVSSRRSIASGGAVTALVSEAIDNVRATLIYDSASQPRQVILVSSPATMEGSTTVASHLALSLTRAGRRTLLIDGDLREPSLHKLFGLPLGDGLCEVLRSEIDVADVIRATNTEGLWLLTSGQCDMDAIHALATDQPQPIFEKLRADFDFVVIDGAPVLGLSDTLSLGQHADGAILTVLRDHSEIRKIHQAAELLKGLGIRLVGAVVNGMPTKADRRVTSFHRAAAKQPRKLPAESVS